MAALFAVGTSCFGLSHQRNPLTDMAAVTKAIFAALLLCAAMAALFAVGTMGTDIRTAMSTHILDMVEDYPSVRRLGWEESCEAPAAAGETFTGPKCKCSKGINCDTTCKKGWKGKAGVNWRNKVDDCLAKTTSREVCGE